MQESSVKKKIRQFRCQLIIEAVIRSGTIGLSLGLCGMMIVLLYGRICNQKILLQEAGITALFLCLMVAMGCYLFWLRPRKKDVLIRVDAMGLQERMITMEELRQETTILAKLQRQDTKEQLDKLRAGSLKTKLYIVPVLCSIAFAIIILFLLFVPIPEKPIDEQAEKNAQEIKVLDEMIVQLAELVEASELSDSHKQDLKEIIDALAMSFTPEDSTLTRTAKIATASKRLELYESSELGEITLLKQQADDSESAQATVQEANAEQKRLSQTIKDMKDIMGTSIDIINMVEGSFWTPGAPSSGTSYDVEPLPEEEPTEGEEPSEDMEPGEGEEPQEGMEPGEGGEPPEDMEGNLNGAGGELIYDPEQGEVSYGSVYEEYYQEILKALTEQEFSEEIREIIEDYANSLE